MRPQASPHACAHPPQPAAGGLASSTRGAPPQPRLLDWLAPQTDALFRWAMARQPDADARRGLAEVAVSVQRLHGRGACRAWLFATALQLAAQPARPGSTAAPAFAGLAPELRLLLRAVARGTLPARVAMAWLQQPMDRVRQRLLHAGRPAHNQNG